MNKCDILKGIVFHDGILRCLWHDHRASKLVVYCTLPQDNEPEESVRIDFVNVFDISHDIDNLSDNDINDLDLDIYEVKCAISESNIVNAQITAHTTERPPVAKVLKISCEQITYKFVI